MSPTETGLVVRVPALDAAIVAWRTRIEDPAPIGVPAHVTVLYPWVAPADLPGALTDLKSLAPSVEPFRFRVEGIGWFGTDVVFASPTPPTPFTALTDVLVDHWPLNLPYGGIHGTSPTPHLTIAAGADPPLMAAAASAIEALLPVDVVADALWVMVGTPDPPVWDARHRIPLGPQP